tara:strand:+ start:740 stop:1063 length:324 start_codon:yes stop_codon:yes gene_type:complete
MENYNPEFNGQISQEEIERMSALAKKNEDKWLLEYIEHLNNDKYWDVDFVDYKCYKVFISEYIDDINHYRDDFIKNGGSISFEDAGWGLYFMATNQEHRLINEPAEA